MNKQITFILALIVCLACFIACKKTHKHDDPAPDTVNIDILSPKPGQEYEVGDTVNMDIHITAPANLHGYEMHLTRLADTSEVFFKEEDFHEKNFLVHQTWVNTGAVHSDMVLEVIAHIDHSGNKASKKVQFHCHAH